MPDYFNSKIKVAVLFAPPASMMHMTDPKDRAASDPKVLPYVVELLEATHLYNLLPYGSLFAHASSKACELFNGNLCKLFLKYVMSGDPEIDDYQRADVLLSYLPSGSGYLNLVHYG